MNIIKLKISHGEEYNEFHFTKNTLINSERNKKGKTTLMRTLMWSFGLKDALLTRGISKRKLITTLVIKHNKRTITIYRNRDSVEVTDDSGTDIYNLEKDSSLFFQRTFGIDHHLFETCIFGVFIDQDHGWNTLNKGKISTNNRHYVLVDDIAEMSIIGDDKNKLKKLVHEIKELKKQSSHLKKFTRAADDIKDYMFHANDEQKEINSKISVYKNKINHANKTILNLRNRKNANEEIKRIISSNNIKVTIDGELHLLTEDNLDVVQWDSSWIKMQIDELNKKINEYNSMINKCTVLLREQSALEDYGIISNKIELAPTQNKVELMLVKSDALKQEKEAELAKLLKLSDDAMEEFKSIIIPVCQHLEVDPDVIMRKKEVKGISGSSRMLLALSIRVAFNKIMLNRAGISFPMIIDSPAANEFDSMSFEKINDLLNSIDNQLIVATLSDSGIEINEDSEIKIEDKLLKGTIVE